MKWTLLIKNSDDVILQRWANPEGIDQSDEVYPLPQDEYATRFGLATAPFDDTNLSDDETHIVIVEDEDSPDDWRQYKYKYTEADGFTLYDGFADVVNLASLNGYGNG